ncbi:DUF4012 domain-containing protein [Nocardioides sp.]|uniref:DUF4012 domain-containing protein n=1 Tax=Nocardioides sp. TaxID=35761 RepID=UPI0025D6A029|nr:DUF4012 domain-containing protein [Nocardioides sp.]
MRRFIAARRTAFHAASPRRRVLAGVTLGLGAVVAVLVLLALPLVVAFFESEAAKNDLSDAKDALVDGQVSEARELTASARGHVDRAQGETNWFGSDVWEALPVVGGSVEDARHLVQALDDATSVAEIGVDLYPAAAGPDATLFRDERVDEATLQRVVAGITRATEHLTSAETALGEVRGSTPLIGWFMSDRRDEAADEVDPMAGAVTDLTPMLERLPDVLGFNGKRSYLITMLNPAELRYSGGATLKFAPVTFDHGKVELGESVQPDGNPQMLTPMSWRPVNRNPFHYPGRHLLTSATFAPSWSVSGLELLRAWDKNQQQHLDGVIAIDVVALAQLLDVTGPITLDGYGELTSENLVRTLVGSYEKYYPDPTAQDSLNDELIPAFKEKFLGDGDFQAKARALATAADERHFAMFFRDRVVQKGFAALGLDGDLADPEGDYFGAFTQNTNGSKVDFYQRRDIDLRVELQPDGSAQDALTVVLGNETPPYSLPGRDPKSWYFTRWAGLALSVFVPKDTEVQDASFLGKAFEPTLRKFYRHGFVATKALLPPASKARFEMRYRVDDAATVDESGELTYHLAFDPQGTVWGQSVRVEVQLPDGYTATDLPDGWTADGGTVSLPNQALSTSQEWEIVATPDD